MTNNLHSSPRRWINATALVVVHLLGFGMLYLVVVQMNWAFRDFFNLVGMQTTSRFQRASMISDMTAGYTPIVLAVLACHLVIVFRLSRSAHRWTSAYSHGALMAMGLIASLWTGWAVHAMTWGQPGLANPPSGIGFQPVMNADHRLEAYATKAPYE